MANILVSQKFYSGGQTSGEPKKRCVPFFIPVSLLVVGKFYTPHFSLVFPGSAGASPSKNYEFSLEG